MLGLDKFLFVLCISLLFLYRAVASVIPLGSRLSVEKFNSWGSSNGDFSVGFFNLSDQPNLYSLGIYFTSKDIPFDKRSVVWTAGGDVSVGCDSYFELSQNGELVLVDSSSGVTVWSTNTSRSAVSSAVLRNDGNLVLLNENNDVVWQSFDNPSDTLLPGQKLSVYKTLRASSSKSLASYYSLYMNASGLMQLRWESNVVYWKSGGPLSSRLSAVLTSEGALQLVDGDSKPVWSVFAEDHNDTVRFRLLRLDVDGNLRMYSWLESTRSWRSVWQAVDNQCNVFATCGEHGICVFNASGFPECQCPFKMASGPNSKCFAQVCEAGSSMVTYDHTFLYGIYPPNDLISHASMQQCKDKCMNDSTCKAATFTNNGRAECRMKTTRYFSGYSDPSLSSVSFVKKCSDPLAADLNLARSSDPPAADLNLPRSSPTRFSSKQSFRLCIPCLIGASSGTIVVLMVIQLGVGWFMYRKRNHSWKKTASAYRGHGSNSLMMLSFDEIKDITENFKYQIGKKMYRGVLPGHQAVAVKDLESTMEASKFRAVVSKIGSIHHKNLVKLNGYCCELDQRLLVYEYVKKGSLEKYIDDDELCKSLTWRWRVETSVSVARGINYLHTGCREFICHGNLKCENVVLDKNFVAKVSEFGLATLYADESPGGEKDVEDFGKMVLTLITGCQNLDDVIEWTYKELIQGQTDSVVDKRLDDTANAEELERMLRIAFWCLQSDKRIRPSIGEVLKVLEGTLSVDPPPPPIFFHGEPAQVESPE